MLLEQEKRREESLAQSFSSPRHDAWARGWSLSCRAPSLSPPLPATLHHDLPRFARMSRAHIYAFIFAGQERRIHNGRATIWDVGSWVVTVSDVGPAHVSPPGRAYISEAPANPSRHEIRSPLAPRARSFYCCCRRRLRSVHREAMAETEKVLTGMETIFGQGEALDRDAIWWVESRIEDGWKARLFEEDTEKRGYPLVSTEASDELGVAEYAAPVWADEGSTGERGWLWREAEENLLVEVLVVQGVNWRGMEAAHPS